MANKEGRIERFFNNIKPFSYITIGDENTAIHLQITSKTETNTLGKKRFFITGYLVNDGLESDISLTYEILGDEYILAIMQEVYY